MCFNIIIVLYSISEDIDFMFNDQTISNPVDPPKFNVSIIDDNIVEHNETFKLSFSIPPNGLNLVTSITELNLTIIDNGKYTHRMISMITDCTYHSMKELLPENREIIMNLFE